MVEAKVTIRRARIADAGAVAAIYAHHVAHGTASFDTQPRSLQETAGKISDCAARGWPFLVVERQGEVVGYAYSTQFRDRPAYAATCENSIYLDPSATGQGLGKLLLAALVAASERAGFRQMIAVVGGGEPASIALHRNLGFCEAGRMVSVGRKNGCWLDTVYLQRSLGEGDSSPPAVEP